jgi:hypothetical protein
MDIIAISSLLKTACVTFSFPLSSSMSGTAKKQLGTGINQASLQQ